MRVGVTLGGGYLDGVTLWERWRYSWVGTSGEGGGGSGDEESPKNNFYHLEYGRDHGPDHLHKGKLNIFEFLPPEAEFFFTTPKQFIL